MSREIKFRVWDTNANDWLHDSLLKETVFGCRSGYHKLDSDGFAVLYPNRDHREYIIEQYTGLKDKNGKEIYEGDIVSSHNGDVLSQIVQSPNGEYRMHHIGIFGGGCSLFPELVFVEVIGNIHENPELLGDKNLEQEEQMAKGMTASTEMRAPTRTLYEFEKDGEE